MKVTELIFATANLHKLAEIRAMLPAAASIKSLADVGFTDEIPETGTTLEENARLKALCIYERYGVPCFADDTGLEVSALNGAPGVYSARYAGCDGTPEERSRANMEKLLHEMVRKSDRSARFRTVIVYMDTANVFHTFEGSVYGQITMAAAGCGGFGYDPVFVPNGYDVTFAEMPPAEKNLMSHRARAFSLFAAAVIG